MHHMYSFIRKITRYQCFIIGLYRHGTIPQIWTISTWSTSCAGVREPGIWVNKPSCSLDDPHHLKGFSLTDGLDCLNGDFVSNHGFLLFVMGEEFASYKMLLGWVGKNTFPLGSGHIRSTCTFAVFLIAVPTTCPINRCFMWKILILIFGKLKPTCMCCGMGNPIDAI